MHEPHEKLVRDGIPAIIRHTGRDCRVSELAPAAYRTALRAKLVEEAREVAAAEGDDLLAELADVQEVYAALLAAYGVDPVAVEACRAQRRAERGGFERRLWLHWVE